MTLAALKPRQINFLGWKLFWSSDCPKKKPLFQPTFQQKKFSDFIQCRQRFSIKCLGAGANFICFLSVTCDRAFFVFFSSLEPKMDREREIENENKSRWESLASYCGFGSGYILEYNTGTLAVTEPREPYIEGRKTNVFCLQATIVSASQNVFATLIFAKMRPWI